LTDQTGTYPASGLATVIDNSGQTGDLHFDMSKVDMDSITGATLGTFNGAQVLLLDTTAKKISYNYNTSFAGAEISSWFWRGGPGVVQPYNKFYLTWDPTDIATDVDGVVATDVSVYTTPGAINISGNISGNVNVYNVGGQQVYCGTDNEITVPAGMYIVKVNGVAHKVQVR
jgi:hypothetical protein